MDTNTKSERALEEETRRGHIAAVSMTAAAILLRELEPSPSPADIAAMSFRLADAFIEEQERRAGS